MFKPFVQTSAPNLIRTAWVGGTTQNENGGETPNLKLVLEAAASLVKASRQPCYFAQFETREGGDMVVRLGRPALKWSSASSANYLLKKACIPNAPGENYWTLVQESEVMRIEIF